MKRYIWKRVLAMVLCFVLLIMCCPIQLAAATEMPLEATVAYTILVTNNNAAVNGANVEVYIGNELQTELSAKTGEDGKAVLSLPKPAEGEAAITYTLLIKADRMRAYELSVEVSNDTEANSEPVAVPLSVAKANLTVKVVDAYGNPCGDAQVTLTAENTEAEPQTKTTGSEDGNLGIAVFEGLDTAESYKLSVAKPNGATPPYCYTDVSTTVPSAPADGNGWHIELSVISCTAEETSREISILSESVGYVEKDGTDGYLLYDLENAGCLNTTLTDSTYSVVLNEVENDKNGKPIAWVSDVHGIEDADGAYIAIASTTTGENKINFTVTEQSSTSRVEKKYAIVVKKANVDFGFSLNADESPSEWNESYEFYCVANNSTFYQPIHILPDTAYKTPTAIAVSVPEGSPLSVDLTKQYVTADKATLNADGNEVYHTVKLTRAADTWYEEATHSFSLMAKRVDRSGTTKFEKTGIAVDYGTAPDENKLVFDEAEVTADNGINETVSVAYSLVSVNVFDIVTNQSVKDKPLASVNENGKVTLTEGVYGTATVKAKIANTGRYNGCERSYTLTVNKTEIHKNEKPFVLALDGDRSNPIPYTYQDGAFTLADAKWYTVGVTLFAADGYTVKITPNDSEEQIEIGEEGYSLPQGENTIQIAFKAENGFECSSKVEVKVDTYAPDVKYTVKGSVKNSLFNVLGFGLVRVYDEAVTVNVTVTDDMSGIGEVTAKVSNEETERKLYSGEEETIVREKFEGFFTIPAVDGVAVTIKVSAKDIAGNLGSSNMYSMSDEENTAFEGLSEEEKEAYNNAQSHAIYFDTLPPEISVTFTKEPVGTVKLDNTEIPLYDLSKGEMTATVEINDGDFEFKTNCSIELTHDGEKVEDILANIIDGENSVDISEDGKYVLTITYQDIAKHPATYNNVESGDGTYTYTFFVDNAAPQVTVDFNTTTIYSNEIPVYTAENLPSFTVDLVEANRQYNDDMTITLTKNGQTENLFKAGEAVKEDGKYTLTVSYVDIAEYDAVYTYPENYGSAKDETYTYTFYVDTTAPTVSYTIQNDAVTSLFNVLGFGLVRVYDEAVTVNVTVSDGEFGSGVEKVKGTVMKEVNGEKVVIAEHNLYTLPENEVAETTPVVESFKIDETTVASIAVKAVDIAKNAETVNSDKTAETEDSFAVTVDKTAPQITVSYNSRPLCYNATDLYNNDTSPEIVVEIVEANYALKPNMVVTLYRDGNSSKNLFAINGNDKGSFRPTEEGDYVLTVSYTDAAKHPAVFNADRGSDADGTYTYAFSVDTAAPSVAVDYSSDPLGMGNNGTPVYGENNLPEISITTTERYYCLKPDMTVTLYKDGNTEENLFAIDNNGNGCFKPTEEGDYVLTVSYTDATKHPAEYSNDRGSAANGTYTYAFSIDTTPPAVTVGFDKEPNDYYGEQQLPVYVEGNLPTLSIATVERYYALKPDVVATLYKDGDTTKNYFAVDNNGNGSFQPTEEGDYVLTVSYTDIANHPAEFAKDRGSAEHGTYIYAFIVDTTRPVCNGVQILTEKQNTLANMWFYQANLTASVGFTERYFNSALFAIYSSQNNGAAVSLPITWNGTTGTVSLAGDGHYKLSATGADDAGHVMDRYEYEPELVLDSIAPVISFSTSAATNEYGNKQYYDNEAICYIEIIEANFYNSESVAVTCTKDGEAYAIGAGDISWSAAGDQHTGSFMLSEEGEYTISLHYSDLSNNNGEYTYEKTIVIDKTDISVTFTDNNGEALLDKTSYNSNAISFTVAFKDENLRAEDLSAKLTAWVAEEGDKGTLKLTEVDFSQYLSAVRTIDEGKSYEIDVLNLGRDAVYTLTVDGTDLAGHTFHETRVFSVNRDGSTYYIEGETEELVKKYYTNTPQDVVIHEVCSEELSETDISISHNLDIEEYQWGDEMNAAASKQRFNVLRDESSRWNEYIYSVKSLNFEEQGDYSVATNSVAAGTSLKKSSAEVVKVNFLMDMTLPTINISGVEDGGRYQTDVQKITVTCEDDQMLDRVEIYLDGQKLEKYSSADMTTQRNVLEVEIAGISEYREQELKIVVQDKAGNEPVEMKVHVYVSTNIWYLYRNYFIIGGAAVIALAAILIIVIIAKKKKATVK